MKKENDSLSSLIAIIIIPFFLVAYAGAYFAKILTNDKKFDVLDWYLKGCRGKFGEDEEK